MIYISNILLTLLLTSFVFADTHFRAKRFGVHAHPVKPRTLQIKRQQGDGLDGLKGGLAGILQGLGDSLGDAGDSLGLGGIVDPIVGTPTVVPVPPTQTSVEDSTDTLSSSNAASPTSGSASATPVTGSASTIPSGSGLNPVDPTDTNPPHNAPLPTTTTTVKFTTTRGGGLIPTLSGILDPPDAPPPTSTAGPGATATDPPVSPQPSSPGRPTSSDDGGILGPILGPPQTNSPPPPPATTEPPTNTETGTTVNPQPPASTSSDDGGILGPILNPPDTNTPPPANTETGTGNQPKPTSSSSDGGILGPILGTPTPTSTDTTKPTSSSSSNGGILGPILGTPTDTSTDTGPSETTVPKPTDAPSSSSTQGGILSTILPIPTIFPPTDNDTSTVIGSGSPTISSTITTPFPSGGGTFSDSSTIFGTSSSSDVLNGTSGIFSSPTDSSSDTITATVSQIPSPIPTQSDDSAFSYITASSLVVDSTTATPTTTSQTDPDAAPSTTKVTVPSAVDATQAPVQVPLPSNMPSKIFSTTSIDPNSPLLNGHSVISILFTLDLNWPFVVNNNQTIGQLFKFMPVLISSSLNIDINTMYTYALQVSIPNAWQGDTSQLGTTYLTYIPTDQIETLTSLMRTPNSAFYTQGGIPGQLANYVIPNSLVQLALNEPTGSSSNDDTTKTNKKRTDAIIGVCVGIGGVAALIGIWWLVKFWQRKQNSKHKRLSNLSDPNVSNGIYGTQHDERRTSFFYAEDELRGGYDTAVVEGNMMTQRMRAQAAVAGHGPGPGPISAPVLQQNSLNW